MAVAFQVVLVVGRAEVVAPVNAAVSINFECTECNSTAIAAQLVATLNAAPGQEVIAAIEAIWDRVEALEDVVEGLSVPEITELVSGFQAEILGVLLEAGPVESTSSVEGDLGTSTTVTPSPPSTSTSTSETTVVEPVPEPQAPPPPAEEPVPTTEAPPETTTTTTEPEPTSTTLAPAPTSG